MQHWILGLAGVAALLGFAQRANADPFKQAKECVTGKRVYDKQGAKGVIVRSADVMCYVKVDGEAREHSYIFWMLAEEGKSHETSDKLVTGTYECFAGGHYTFMDMYITGPNRYKTGAGPGSFRVLPTNQIVFDTGPLSKYRSKLAAGPAILLNSNGDSFYGTSCELKKTR